MYVFFEYGHCASKEAYPGKVKTLPQIATPVLQSVKRGPHSVRVRAPRSPDAPQALPEHRANRGSAPTRWEGVVVAWQIWGTRQESELCLRPVGSRVKLIWKICYLGILQCHCSETTFRGERGSPMTYISGVTHCCRVHVTVIDAQI